MPRSKKRKKNGVTVRPPGSPVVHTPPPPTPTVTRRVSTSTQFEQYTGSVPHPEHARAFEEILPGSFDRFITMAERQSGHRQWMEKGYLLLNSVVQFAGVLAGTAAILGGMYFGYELLMHDKGIEGFTAMITPLGAVCATFFGALRSQAREKQRKAIAERG